MIQGVVMQRREAIVRLEIRGAQGLDVGIDAVLDTGFTEYLSLPRTWITALALTYLFTDAVILADGSKIGVDLFECVVIWDGQERAVTVHCMEGMPLIGMSLLYDYLLTMEVIDGGNVTLAPMP
jgi:clan AA aspartic protease